MKKVICSSQSLSLETPLKAMLVSSMILGALLPLSAVAMDELEVSSAEQKIFVEIDQSASSTELSNTNSVDDKESSDNKVIQEAAIDIPTTAAVSSNSESNITQEIDPMDINGDLPVIESQEKISESKLVGKSPSWMSLEYLLGGGGLLLLLLGGGFLLLSKFNNLKNENQELVDKNSSLKKQGSSQAMLVSNIKNENKNLESEVSRLKGMLDGYANTYDDKNTDASDLLSMPSLITPEPARFEELNESDRGQLASIFESWLKTNRGNTKVDDLIPDDINKKIKHLHYTIELWGQGSGLDSVESTKNTMHTAVISLIKNDNKGYAYCYIKPNSMSSLWNNKAWYAVEKSNGTLKLTGEPLEAN